MSLDYDTLVVLVACVTAMACALPGVFLVVRGMGLMGEAISHAVLPGIAVGFLISGTRDSVWMFAGAAIAGILVAMLTQVLHRIANVDRGAAMGTAFTVFFALGLVLMVQLADTVNIDPHTVLYGALELTPLDTVAIFGMHLPRAMGPICVVLTCSIVTFAVLWKELRIACFDPALAQTLGMRPELMHHIVMVLTAATCVACFEAVGSVMTVTFIVAPAATALLLSRSLSVVVGIALVLGVITAIAGHWAALHVPELFLGEGFDTSSSGAMAFVSGVVFVMALLCAPRRGVIARRLALRRLVFDVAIEDALGLIYRLEESNVEQTANQIPQLLARDVRVGPRRVQRVLSTLTRRGLAVVEHGVWSLTHEGHAAAAGLVRAHRLWETYLAATVDVPASHLHTAAERLEHVTTEALAKKLADATGDAAIDPHGRAIPPESE